jgi:hypothetical protein
MALVAFNSQLEEVCTENLVSMPKSSTQIEVDDHGNIFVMYYICERVGCAFNMTNKVRVFSTRLWRIVGEADVDTDNQFKLVDNNQIVLFSNKTKKFSTLKFSPSMASSPNGGFLKVDEQCFPNLKGDVYIVKDRMSDCVSLYNKTNLSVLFN